jgi:phage tail-like protein
MKPKYELVIQHPSGAESRAYFLAATGLRQKSRKLQGLRKFTNITLKRGYTSDGSLFRWHQANSKKKGKGSKASVYLLDDSGERILRWTFNALPSKFQPPKLNATGNEVEIEELELHGEGIQVGVLD